jgi:superfamily II DNA or RNA helicase
METVLVLNNDYSYLLTEDVVIKRELYDRLRFRDKNYFHNRAYKMKKWDGFINFFSKENGKFLSGLLPEVTAVLRHNKIEYTVRDERSKTQFICDSIGPDFLNQWLPKNEDGTPASPITLYDYQVESTNMALKHKRGVITAPTGAGKTNIMISFLKTIAPNTPTLVLQNRVSLAQQNYEELMKWGFPNVGTLWGGSVAPNMITVASVQSIAKMEKVLPKIKVLIVDEIHDMMSALPKAVYKKLKSADVRLAVSATPFKFGGKDAVQKFYVRGFFGPVLKIKSTDSGVLTTADLQERGILANSKCIFYPIREPKIEHDIYIDAVTRGIAESFYFHDVVTRLAKSMKGRTLILVDRIAHGDALNNLLPGSLWVRGQDDAETRKGVIKQLQKGKGDLIAIATQQIFNTGINVHPNNLINAASGQADHMIIQRMGRGLRTASDKERLNYYDFVFEINPYLLEHSNKRINILRKEGHDVEIREIDF